ncbi:acetylcholine receptor subunit alpha-like [Branchiostoma floridae x Branchiostoma japonicum]
MCSPQEYTAFPNFLHHLSEADVTNWEGFLGIKQLSSKTCHQQIQDFVCYLLVPPCSSVTRDPPCRSWCEELKGACGTETGWSQVPDCGTFVNTDCWSGAPAGYYLCLKGACGTETGWSQVPDCGTFVNTDCWSGAPADCYHGNGENYRGVQSVAGTGQSCYRWEEKPLELQQYPWAHLRDNYCRNPDGTDRPWCYVDQAGGWEFCSVKPCDESLLCRDRGSERGVLMKPVRQFYSRGDTVSYSCVQGYTLLGSAAARCLGNHIWDTEAPICKVESRERLLNDKFIEGEYSPTLSPTVGVVNITIAGSIVSIINLDESTETVTTAFRVGLTWHDQRLSWDVFHYGVSKVRVDHDTVWKPTLKLLRSADKDFGGFPKADLTMFNTGQVTWIIEDIIVTTCDLNHFLFPFDTITCPVCLHTDVENEEELICSGNTTTAEVHGCHDPRTLKSGEWTATVNMTVSDRRKACLSMKLVRDPTFHMCTTVSPSIVLVLLMCITFFIPIDKGDRLSWGMSILLSMFVSLVVISDYLPKTGHFPLFGVLTIVAITLAGLFMWLTTVVIALSGKEGDMPGWAVVFFLKYMAMAMLLGDMTKKRDVKKETPSFTEDVMIMRFNPLHQPFPPPLDIAEDDEEMPRRRRNHLRVLASINAVMWGLKDSMDGIRTSLDSLNDWLKRQDEQNSLVQTESDWMMLSHVLDRLCLVVYLGTIFLAVPIVYHIG